MTVSGDDFGEFPEYYGWVEFSDGMFTGVGSDGWPIFPEDYDPPHSERFRRREVDDGQ